MEDTVCAMQVSWEVHSSRRIWEQLPVEGGQAGLLSRGTPHGPPVQRGEFEVSLETKGNFRSLIVWPGAERMDWEVGGIELRREEMDVAVSLVGTRKIETRGYICELSWSWSQIC